MATAEFVLPSRSVTITAVFSPAARQVYEQLLRLEAGSTIASVLASLQRLPGFESLHNLNAETITVGVWGQKAASSHVLKNGDRLEIYRLLLVDPKVARRVRFKGQGVKTKGAGLFAKRRVGAKAGY